MNWLALPPQMKDLFRSTRRNAASRGIEFELTNDTFAAAWYASDRKCALTGIKLDVYGERRGEWLRNPYAPSVDRIDCSAGYRLSNIRFVCVAVNIALNEWGETVLREIAHGLFGSDPSRHQRTRSDGLLKGISPFTRDGRTFYRVRIHVDGKLVDCGAHANYEAAVLALERGRSSNEFVDSLSLGIEK